MTNNLTLSHKLKFNAGTTLGSTTAWVTKSYITAPTLSPSTDYVLWVIIDYITNGYYARYDAGGTNQAYYDDGNNYTTPVNPTVDYTLNNKFSIYATYTAADTSYTGPFPTFRQQ